MTRVLRLTLVLVIAVSTALLLGTGVSLPPEVASHFGHSGAADGWMSRTAYLCLMTALVAVLPLFLAATSGLLPKWSRRNRLMRHPEYWLAPPRRAATEAFLESYACAFGIALCLFMLGMHFLLIEANALTPPRLPMHAFFAVLGVFGAVVVALLAALFVRFRAIG